MNPLGTMAISHSKLVVLRGKGRQAGPYKSWEEGKKLWEPVELGDMII